MQRPKTKLPLLETDGNIMIESFDLSKVAKGEINFVCKVDGGKLSKEKINLNKLFPENHMHLIPAKEIIEYFNAVQKIATKRLTPKENERYDACIKRFLCACVSKNNPEIAASAHGLLAHQLTLYNKYEMGADDKKPKKVLVLYMNNPERWDETQPLDIDMYTLSKVIAEKKRAAGHDVTLANLHQPGDIPELLKKLGKKKFSDVCLVGHSLRYNYDKFKKPFKKPAPLHDVACLHIGGFTVEDCADLLYRLSINHGISTVKSFACESGIMAKRQLAADGETYDDQGEVPHDIDLLSEAPSVIQLTLAHVALLAQMDKNEKKMNLLAIAPNGIAYIDAANNYKFRIIDPRNYFQDRFVAREDIIPRTKNRLFIAPEAGQEALQQRAKHARSKLEHKLLTLKDRLPLSADKDVARLIKREISALETLLSPPKQENKSKPNPSK